MAEGEENTSSPVERILPQEEKTFPWKLFLPLMVLMLVVFTYTNTPSRVKGEHITNYYQLLSEAFLKGQTYLDIKPSEKLLSLPDPYDPEQHRPYSQWDASLYQGKYYLYFGPVPALVLWIPAHFLFDISLSCAAMALIFTSIATAVLAALLICIALKEDIITSPIALACCLLSLMFCNWLPFMLSRSTFYEAAISGAYCFNAVGLLLLWHALQQKLEEDRLLLLAAGSLCLGLAVGCRNTHVLNIVLLLLVAWKLLWPVGNISKAIKYIASIFLPWGICLLALMMYNYARFDNPFEPGMRYQLTVANFNAPNFHFMSAGSIIPNLYFYLLRPLEWDFSHFPGSLTVENFFYTTLPGGISAVTQEPVYGLITNSPFILFLPAGLIFFYCKKSSAIPSWFSMAIGGYGALLFIILTMFYFVTTRYSVDFSPWLMFAAGYGFLRIMKHSPRTYLPLGLGVAATLYGTYNGIMLGIHG